MRPKIGLALGSGGLRGLAHVGVLAVLEEEGIPVDCIAGCSIGALVGALYCSGHSPETILKLAKNLKRRHWLDFVVPKMGIFSGDRILETMRLLTQRKTFADLDIPLAIVATEICLGKEIVFTQGDLAKAVRASVSVPGVFVPYQWDDMLLVDGAVVNPTPVDAAGKLGADVVIAVDLAHTGTVCKLSNMFDIIIQSIDIMEKQLCQHRQHPCSVLICPKVGDISPSSFEAADECYQLGRAAAAAAVGQIKQLLADGCPENRKQVNMQISK